MTPETKARLKDRARKMLSQMRRSGEDDMLYGEPDYDVNVYVFGERVKAVAYPVNPDNTTDYSTIINLWEKPL